MKTVELRRHTDNEDDRLSDQGVADAGELASGLHPPYDLLVSSGAGRAVQTLQIWRTAVAGEAPLEEERGLRSQREDEWRQAYQDADSSDLVRMRDAAPDLVREDAERLGAALRRIFHRLPEGGRALVVGHTPTNEAAVFGLTGEFVAAIGKGSGVVIVQDSDGYRVQPL